MNGSVDDAYRTSHGGRWMGGVGLVHRSWVGGNNTGPTGVPTCVHWSFKRSSLLERILHCRRHPR